MHNLQQPTKKIDLAVYLKLLYELKIPSHLVSNTHAKKYLKKVYSQEEKEEETEPCQGKSEQQKSERSSGSQSKDSGSKPAEPKNQTNKKTEQETKEKNCFIIKDVQLLDRLYSKGPASFGITKAITSFEQTTNDKGQNVFGNKTILHKILCSAVEFSSIKSNHQRSE